MPQKLLWGDVHLMGMGACSPQALLPRNQAGAASGAMLCRGCPGLQEGGEQLHIGALYPAESSGAAQAAGEPDCTGRHHPTPAVTCMLPTQLGHACQLVVAKLKSRINPES